MSFIDRMTAGEEIAARYRGGDIDRETALIELALAFDGTLITEQGINSFLDYHAASPPEAPADRRGGRAPRYDTGWEGR